jgi:integrase
MLAEMFPRIHGRVAALWVLGPLLDEFVGWLHARGFPRLPIRLRVRAAPRLAARLRRRGIRDIGELSRDDLLALAPRDAAADVYLGRRDYAIFLLIATYGLRTSEVAGLRLDDVEWRASRLRVRRPKTRTPLVLPLTDAVGAALLDYLRHARPPRPACRALFLRVRAPAGPLARTGVTEAFQGWTRRSRLPIPYHGPHCLRHSLAVHLLRQGTSLKAIGDLLGHRSPESTCVYLRLDVEDLRDAALPLPPAVQP